MRVIKDVREHLHNVSKLGNLDKKLLNALIQPAIDDGYLLDSSLKWQDLSYKHKANNFTKAILDLSEFYRVANPVLSSALWGIWNSIDYFEKQHGLFWAFLIAFRKWRQERYFLHYRALVATAVCHFADGTPETHITSDAVVNIDVYENLVRQAIKHLKVCGEKAKGTW